MLRYQFFDISTGHAMHTSTPVHSGLYEHKGIYGDAIAVELPRVIIGSDDELRAIIHWTGSEIGWHQPKPDHHYIWDKSTFSYIEPPNYFKTLQNEAKERVNQAASGKIFARYSQGKQLSLNVRYNKLTADGLSGTDEWNAIEAIYAWIDSVVAASNTARAELDKTTSIAEIANKEQAYKIALDKL